MKHQPKRRRLTPSYLKEQIKEIRAHLDSLESYAETQARRHKKIDDGNGTYDPVEYKLFQVMLHASMVRSKLDMKKSAEGADGDGKKFCRLVDGSLFNCYEA